MSRASARAHKSSFLHVEVDGTPPGRVSQHNGSQRNLSSQSADPYNINSPKIPKPPSKQFVTPHAGGDGTASAAYSTPARSSARDLMRSASGPPATTPSHVTGAPSIQPANPSSATPGGYSGSTGRAAGEEAVVPAGLAALLHQADKSGKQQKAVVTPGSTPAAAQRTTPASNWARTPQNGPSQAYQLNTGTPKAAASGAGAMPQAPTTVTRTPAMPSRRTVMAPTPVSPTTAAAMVAAQSQSRHQEGKGGVPHSPSFLDRLMSALCCSNTRVAQSHTTNNQAPQPPPKQHSISSGPVAALPGPAPRAAKLPSHPSTATMDGGNLYGSKRLQRRKWVRPPPPKHRINNVIRPSSTYGDGPMLGPLLECDRGRKCLVLDLDETLVHSSFRAVPNPDYILPVEIDGTVHSVYVCKRPGCDEFLQRCGQLYEVVIFTASLAKYADPLLDLLDPTNVIRARLFREACVHHEGSFVKDLSLLGRDPTDVIIIDNSPASYLFQPENALPCESFIDDPSDRELWALLAFLETIVRVEDVREALLRWVSGTFNGVDGLALVPDPEDLYVEVETDDQDEGTLDTLPDDTSDNLFTHPVNDLGQNTLPSATFNTTPGRHGSDGEGQTRVASSTARTPSDTPQQTHSHAKTSESEVVDLKSDEAAGGRAPSQGLAPVYNISVQVSVLPTTSGPVGPVTVSVPIPQQGNVSKDDSFDPVEEKEYRRQNVQGRTAVY